MPLKPHIIVESSPGKFHGYLLVEGLSRDEFATVMSVMVNEYGSDKNAADLARVLRIPGFWNQKARYPEPFQVRIVHESGATPYTREQILEAFKPDPVAAHESEPDPEQTESVSVDPDMLRKAKRIALDAAIRTENDHKLGRHREIFKIGAFIRRDLFKRIERPDPQAEAVILDAALTTFSKNMRPTSTSGQTVGMNWDAGRKAIRDGFRNPNGEPDRPGTRKGDGDGMGFYFGASGAANEEAEGFSLDQFSLNGQSREMEQRMLEDRFVLGELALLGQITYFYAPPNAGKTLITLRLLIDAIKARNIDPAKVYYINADDNHKGLTFKLKLAEQWGFHMLSPGYNGFSDALFSEYLTKLSQSDNASGTVIILDTLKMFADIMDKRKGTDFGKVARLYSAKGGTLIGLAHVNKHKDHEGKSVYSGTTDMRDDGDCAYIVEVVREDKSSGLKTVCFENQKNRGDVALEASYQYLFYQDATYQEPD